MVVLDSSHSRPDLIYFFHSRQLSSRTLSKLIPTSITFRSIIAEWLEPIRKIKNNSSTAVMSFKKWSYEIALISLSAPTPPPSSPSTRYFGARISSRFKWLFFSAWAFTLDYSPFPYGSPGTHPLIRNVTVSIKLRAKKRNIFGSTFVAFDPRFVMPTLGRRKS